MMLYQHSDEDDDTAPLLVPTILPSATTTTTRSSRSSKRIVIVTVVAAMTMLVVTGGTVWLRNGSSYTTAAEGLVVATQDGTECVPAALDATFGGTSTTTTIGNFDAFQTCYQYGNEKKYCWSNSCTAINFFQTLHYQCVPKGRRLMDGAWLAGQWDDIDPKYVVPYKTCGPPCQDMIN